MPYQFTGRTRRRAMPALDLTYREVKGAGDERAFVINSWLLSYEYQAREVQGMLRDAYYREHTPRVVWCLDNATTIMATMKNDPDFFIGWACGVIGRVYYVYVKKPFRRAGVATELVRQVAGDKPGTIRAMTRQRGFYEAYKRKGWQFRAEAPHPQDTTGSGADNRSEQTTGAAERSGDPGGGVLQKPGTDAGQLHPGHEVREAGQGEGDHSPGDLVQRPIRGGDDNDGEPTGSENAGVPGQHSGAETCQG